MGEIAAHALTGGNADDAAQAPDLLRQAERGVAGVTTPVSDAASTSNTMAGTAPLRQGSARV